MASTRETGSNAESIACNYISSLGYKILDINWYHRHLELDIVAIDGKYLVIIEVKSRNGYKFDHPLEAVTRKKIEHIINAAEAYIYIKNIKLETRFDIITIIFEDRDYELEHFKDAFYPTL